MSGMGCSNAELAFFEQGQLSLRKNSSQYVGALKRIGAGMLEMVVSLTGVARALAKKCAEALAKTPAVLQADNAFAGSMRILLEGADSIPCLRLQRYMERVILWLYEAPAHTCSCTIYRHLNVRRRPLRRTKSSRLKRLAISARQQRMWPWQRELGRLSLEEMQSKAPVNSLAAENSGR